MGFKSEKELDAYLTRPSRHLNKVIYDPKIKSNTDQRTAPLNKNPNTKVTPKNEIIVPGALEQLTEKTEKEVMNDPNLLRRIKYVAETYDNMKLGADFDKAIAQEDKNLATAKGKTIIQRYPKEATPQQMAELKTKIDKYKDIHFPKKPNSQPKKKSAVLSIQPDPRFMKIEKEVKEITKPEPFDLNKYIKEKADQRLKAEQEAWDKTYGRGGITELKRPV